jgi:propanol-preferring alcohol dehydrogenase
MADVQIPKKHKAAVYDKPGSISTKIEELDVPEPGAGEVLINLYVSLSSPISHTHQNRLLPGLIHTDIPQLPLRRLPLRHGRDAQRLEDAAKIVKMGPGTENAAVKLGDRVGIKWMAGICEACEACRAGMDACCFNGVRIYPSTHQFNAV